MLNVPYSGDDPRISEALRYLQGVLWADPAMRLDKDIDASARIDLYGTGTKAFWRGLLETGGYIGMSAAGGERAYPRVELKASYSILTKFLAFLQEEIYARNGVEWQWDADGKLAWQAMGEFLRLTGQKAQEVVRVLYLGETVGREGARRMADQIVQWVGRK